MMSFAKPPVVGDLARSPLSLLRIAVSVYTLLLNEALINLGVERALDLDLSDVRVPRIEEKAGLTGHDRRRDLKDRRWLLPRPRIADLLHRLRRWI